MGLHFVFGAVQPVGYLPTQVAVLPSADKLQLNVLGAALLFLLSRSICREKAGM